jgi:DNA-binding LacI/PurR family transcriptional regulator
MRQSLSAHELRQIAAVAVCDPRSVARYLRGEKTSSITRARVEAALRELTASGVAT